MRTVNTQFNRVAGDEAEVRGMGLLMAHGFQ